MKTKSQDSLPERVPFAAIPTGETPDIRRWAQPVVWTDRMLTTLLENKVKGGKWHALIDKIYAPLNLEAAARTELARHGHRLVTIRIVAERRIAVPLVGSHQLDHLCCHLVGGPARVDDHEVLHHLGELEVVVTPSPERLERPLPFSREQKLGRRIEIDHEVRLRVQA